MLRASTFGHKINTKNISVTSPSHSEKLSCGAKTSRQRHKTTSDKRKMDVPSSSVTEGTSGQHESILTWRRERNLQLWSWEPSVDLCSGKDASDVEPDTSEAAGAERGTWKPQGRGCNSSTRCIPTEFLSFLPKWFPGNIRGFCTCSSVQANANANTIGVCNNVCNTVCYCVTLCYTVTL